MNFKASDLLFVLSYVLIQFGKVIMDGGTPAAALGMCQLCSLVFPSIMCMIPAMEYINKLA